MTDPSNIRPHTIVLDRIDEDILGEKAATLSRLTRAFEAQIAHYHAVSTSLDQEERRAELEKLADRLWPFLICREAIGLKDTERLFRDYRIPPAVRAYMGRSTSI